MAPPGSRDLEFSSAFPMAIRPGTVLNGTYQVLRLVGAGDG